APATKGVIAQAAEDGQWRLHASRRGYPIVPAHGRDEERAACRRAHNGHIIIPVRRGQRHTWKTAAVDDSLPGLNAAGADIVLVPDADDVATSRVAHYRGIRSAAAIDRYRRADAVEAVQPEGDHVGAGPALDRDGRRRGSFRDGNKIVAGAAQKVELFEAGIADIETVGDGHA